MHPSHFRQHRINGAQNAKVRASKCKLRQRGPVQELCLSGEVQKLREEASEIVQKLLDKAKAGSECP